MSQKTAIIVKGETKDRHNTLIYSKSNLCKDCTIMYKDCLGIMKEQCKKNLLMIVVHGETLRSPAPQPMDDDEFVQKVVLIATICERFT